ncbi:MAG: hypothetical protein J5606_09095 [Bacteroidales bacterium]|nr:hypothetical protein [Bacteroidales bacterium]
MIILLKSAFFRILFKLYYPKHIAVIVGFILSFMTLPTFAQSFYTIRGEKVRLNEKNPTIAVVYHTNSCSACMKSLSVFLVNQCNENKINLVVLIPESNVSIMRAQTMALGNYFDKDSMPLVVYDLNPDKEKQYVPQYKIEHFPCVILFPPREKAIYISYAQLFGSTKKAILKKNWEYLKEFIKNTEKTNVQQ